MPGDEPEVPAVEPIDPVVSASDLVTPSEGRKLPNAEPVSYPAAKSPPETVASRTSRRQLAKQSMDPEDAPRTRGGTRAQTLSLDRKSSALNDGGAEQAKMAVSSRDGGVITAPVD